MEIIRGRLSAADFSPPSLRYDTDCDCVQFTPDGGATWVDSPSADPRHSPLFLLPPLATADPRCDSAANKVKWLKDFIDQVTELLEAGALAFALVNKALEIMALIFDPSILLLAISEACATLFGIGGTALLAAFTSDQYDLLLCIFLCNCAPDGTVSPEQFAIIQAQVTDQLNTTAGLVVNLILGIQGEIGLSNAGVVGGETGDCDDCDTCNWRGCIDFTVRDGGFLPQPHMGNPTNGNYVAGVGWQPVTINPPNPTWRGLYIVLTLADVANFTSFKITYNYTHGNGFNNVNANVGSFGVVGGAPYTDTGDDKTYTVTGFSNSDTIVLYFWVNETSPVVGTCTIKSIECEGGGDKPPEFDDC